MIYFVGATRLDGIKIGFTDDQMERRLEALQVSCPVALQVIATFEGRYCTESRIHNVLWRSRTCGEWFANEPTMGFIEAAQKTSLEEALEEYEIAEDERLSGVRARSRKIELLAAKIVSDAVTRFGMAAVCDVMGADETTVRRNRKGESVPQVHRFVNLLDLDPQALDPLLELFGTKLRGVVHEDDTLKLRSVA